MRLQKWPKYVVFKFYCIFINKYFGPKGPNMLKNSKSHFFHNPRHYKHFWKKREKISFLDFLYYFSLKRKYLKRCWSNLYLQHIKFVSMPKIQVCFCHIYFHTLFVQPRKHWCHKIRSNLIDEVPLKVSSVVTK